MPVMVFRSATVYSSGVNGTHNHNQRSFNLTEREKADHIEFNRTPLNGVCLGLEDTRIGHRKNLDELKNIQDELGIKQKKFRSNRVVMLEQVFSASADFFYKDLDKVEFDSLTLTKPGDRERLNEIFNNQLDKNAVNEFEKTLIEYCKKQFGDNVVNLTRHLDEKTPHWHLTLTPIIDNKLDNKNFWSYAGKTTHIWHDKLAVAFNHLGIERGVENSTDIHLNSKEHHKALRDIPDVPVITIPKLLKEENIFKANLFGKKKQVISTEDIIKNSLDRDKAISVKYEFYKDFFNKNKQSVSSIKDIKKENNLLKMENKTLKQKNHKFTDEQINISKSIKLEEVLINLGYDLKKEGDYYRLKTDKINLVVNTNNNTFIDNKTQKTGNNAVQLLEKVFDYNFKGAVDYLLGSGFKSEDLAKVLVLEKDKSIQANKIIVDAVFKELPVKVPSKENNVVNYLVNERKISKDLVDYLVNKGSIYGDYNNNVVFVNEDKNYAYSRGTYSANGEKNRFKKSTNSGFINYSNDSEKKAVYLFEGVFDALSYKTLNPNAKGDFIVCSGNQMIDKLKDLKLNEYQNVVCCFDNDKQGLLFDEKVKKLTDNKAVIEKPINKDFNEDLIKFTELKAVHSEVNKVNLDYKKQYNEMLEKIIKSKEQKEYIKSNKKGFDFER